MSNIQYDAQGNAIHPGGHGQQVATLDRNNLPAHLQGVTPQAGNALDAGAGIGGPRLSIKGKQFRFIENDQERVHPFGQPLHVIMVIADPHEGVAKNFYEGSYVEGEDQAPVCYSSDGVTPDAGAEKPQCSTCAACPHNKFGTSVKQDGTMGAGKACRDFKRVYVIPYDQPTSDVYEMRIPPTSFKPMQNYGRELSRAGVPLHGAVTTLNFTSDTSPVLTFQFGGYVPGDAFAKINERVTSGELDAVLPSKNKAPAQAAGQEAPAGGLGITHQPEVEHAPQPVQPPAEPPAAPAAPAPVACPLGAPAGFKMTEKGGGVRYEAFVGQGWNDKLLIDNGYMVQV